ncbi:Aly/REF export factor 2 [Clonorchis sinensis]|uniref:Aly/REF export factor 2 n=2 Tax=Clonorchis sinensis TaxID=79923 RepID=A8WDL9_CLOSI|nr:transcriptional coactivator [Clonorchis sinensis]KAG5449572.1 Aly/REF export factor 2 [Clonorchis sinensis]
MDLSLDDIIQRNRKQPRGRGRARGANPLRGVRRGGIARRSTGGGARVLPEKWQHDMFQGGRDGRQTSVSNKLHISNLDFGVSNDDINELFREFGAIRRAAVHYDRSGRSLGTAEVVFLNPLSATKARSHYNGVPLDGRPMVIQLVGAGSTAESIRPRITPPRRRVSVPRGRGNFSGRLSSRGRGRGRARRPVVTKEELDAELAAYNAKRG